MTRKFERRENPETSAEILQKRPKSVWRKWLRRTALILAILAALPVGAYFVLSLLFPFPVAEIEAVKRGERSTLVQDREGKLLRPFLGQDETWLFWVDLDRISPRLIEATVATEDERFYRHPGVDPISVVRAAWSNLRARRIVSGASTISMQVIRLLDQRPRTFSAKAVEAFRALQLERLLSKRQILELYFNLAPYGGNLVGPEAASLAYFRKHACDLTLGEAALLAGLVQSPAHMRLDRYPERAELRRNHVLQRMRENGCISGERYQVALKEPVRRAPRTPFSFDAPQFCEMVVRENPGQSVLKTTLDRRIQALAETALREGVDAVRPSGATNGAVVVIENGSAAVRALVGSCDFSSVEDLGQINGALALRSPGSALKPFIYALALEQGQITPDSILADVPTAYVGYDPENYDRQYRGPITAREALWASRNVPAVGLAERVGQRRLCGFLKEAGLTSLTEAPEHYGLSIALGSTEVSLLELTNAYAALARLGEYRPYRTLETQPTAPGKRILSEAAAWLVADMLSDMSRLGGKPLWKSERGQTRMAWKTGTSNGHRDAWTVAYTPEYTVGVWLGNFSGKPSRALVGIEAAAPIAARIMDLVYAEKPPTWYPMPASVGARTICALSGMPVGEHCPHSASGWFIPGVSPDRACSVHVAVKPSNGAAERVIEVWPDELAGWLRQHGGRPAEAPHPAAGRISDDRSRPQILSPMPRQTYVLEEGAGDRQKLLFQAASAGRRIYWFVDGQIYRDCPPDAQTFWALRRGEHKVTCSDDSGRSASVNISVQ